MSDTELTPSVAARLKFLEDQFCDMESRLAALEGQKQNSPENNQLPVVQAPIANDEKTSSISVSLIRKSFHKANIMAGDAGDRIDFALNFKSNIDKDLRAFKGAIVIKDLFDEVVLRVTLMQETGLAAGGTSLWEGGIQYNQFLPNHQRLLGLDTNDAGVSFEVENLIYSDGTRESFA
jgi:hypothetical protein